MKLQWGKTVFSGKLLVSEGLEGVIPSTYADSPFQKSVQPGREALPAARAAAVSQEERRENCW